MKDESADKTMRIEQKLGLLVLVLLLIGCVMVLQPFWSSLMWAGVLCFTLWPTQTRLRRWLRNQHTLAALVMTISIALVLVVPFVVIGVRLADDARALSKAAKKWADSDRPEPPPWMESIPTRGPSHGGLFQRTGRRHRASHPAA
jgi:predicted PurR-regulated permease PerM